MASSVNFKLQQNGELQLYNHYLSCWDTSGRRREVNYTDSRIKIRLHISSIYLSSLKFTLIAKRHVVSTRCHIFKNFKGILRNILVQLYLSCKTIRMYDYCNACNYLTFATLKCVKSPSLEVREQEILKLNDSLILKTSDANVRSLSPVLATGKMQNYSHSLTLSNTTAL